LAAGKEVAEVLRQFTDTYTSLAVQVRAPSAPTLLLLLLLLLPHSVRHRCVPCSYGFVCLAALLCQRGG
jgi:hypothetical protein